MKVLSCATCGHKPDEEHLNIIAIARLVSRDMCLSYAVEWDTFMVNAIFVKYWECGHCYALNRVPREDELNE